MGRKQGTLLGSYVPMAFGSGLYTSLTANGEDAKTARKNTIVATIKMLAIAGQYTENQIGIENDVSLSAREPSLPISKKSDPNNYASNSAVLKDAILQVPNNLSDGVNYLASNRNALSIREQGGAVEIFYKA